MLFFSVGVQADVSEKRIEWYLTPTYDGSRPRGAVSEDYLAENGAFYLGPDEKVVYLTFDLGYENENVGRILDTLKKEKVPATFFLLRHTVQNGKYLGEIAASHLAANHTLYHKDMTKIGNINDFRAELDGLSDLYREKTGKEMAKIYRPPCGAFSEQNLAFAKELGYKTAFWSLAYADWDERAQPDPAAALQKVLSRIHNGAVILLHPTSSANAKILPSLIARLKKEGYRFETLDKI